MLKINMQNDNMPMKLTYALSNVLQGNRMIFQLLEYIFN